MVKDNIHANKPESNKTNTNSQDIRNSYNYTSGRESTKYVTSIKESNIFPNNSKINKKNSKLEINSIKHLNFLLKSEKLPLRVRLLSKYFFFKQKEPDVVLAVFLTCKMLEHRLHLSFLHEYDNHAEEYAEREMDFLNLINFELNQSLTFIDFYISIFKLFEQGVKVSLNKNKSFEIIGELMKKFREIFDENSKNVNASENLKRFKKSFGETPVKGNYLANLFSYLKNKTNILNNENKIDNSRKLHKIFERTFYEEENTGGGILEGFTGREVEMNMREDPIKRFSQFISIIENLHETPLVTEFYESSEFPIYILFAFLNSFELNYLSIIFNIKIDKEMLEVYRNKLGTLN